MIDPLSKDETCKFESEVALNETYDFNYEAKLKQKYIILCSPRSGSTMLANALYNTGLAGAPFEYFNRKILKARNNPELRPNELSFYLNEMIRRRTSPNGYFGMTLQFEQFEYLFGRNATVTSVGMTFLSEFDRKILVYRRDKISQAVSFWLARENSVWSMPNRAKTGLLQRTLNPTDVIEICDLLRTFVAWDDLWRKVISRLEGSCMEVAYEDLRSDPQAEFGKIFEYLGLRELRDSQLSVPKLKSEDPALTTELKRLYLEKIGAIDATGVVISEKVVRSNDPVGAAKIESSGSLPDFLIIGAQKAGTTALGWNLSRHPDVYMARAIDPTHEVHFFDTNWHRGLDWYRKCFTRPDKLQGEKTPTYLPFPHCHTRMAAVVPNAKLVISLRNPVDRAYSAWNFFNQISDEARSWGWEPMPFREAIEQVHIPVMRNLLDSGDYFSKIKHLLKYYSRENLHIVIAERLRANREDEYAKLLTFLGLPLSPEPFQDVHVREYPEPLAPDLREHLASHYAESNAELFAFLGEEIAEWD
jgi:LPS sulfotransferase NodH